VFEITLDGKTLYNPNSAECNVKNAVIHEKLNDAGYMDITIPYSNPIYDELQERNGKIIVYKDNVEIWYGDVRDISVDFSKNKIIYVVGEAIYLNDTVQPQRTLKGTKFQILQEILNHHNSMCGSGKEFEIGMIGNNSSSSMEIVTDWEYSLDAIRNHLCEDEEYFRIRHVNKVRYIDIMPISSYGKHSDQNIMFGENLLDYAEESTGEKIATVCIPLGATIEDGGIEGYENYLTCESANNGKNYVELQGAINRIGRITKVVHFNVLKDPKALVTAAINYLQSSQYAKLTLKLSAVDLSILYSDIDNYAVGDYVRAICEPMGMDAWFPVRERETDLLNLANNKIVIGSEGTKSITAQNAESITELEKIMPNKDSILNAAKKNATALINGAGTNGHVVFHTNDNGVVYEILIMDTPDINTAQKMWRWNENGFGYRKRKSDGTWDDYDVAMTMDGEINANYITTGTMNCDRLDGGTIKGQTINGGTISIGSNFSVDNSGNMSCSNATFNGNIESKHSDGAYAQLENGTIKTNRTISCYAVSATESLNAESVASNSYSAGSEGGKSTKAFSFMAYVDNEEKWEALRFREGILVGKNDAI